MNNLKPNEEPGLLDELLVETPQKGKFFNLLTISLFVFIAVIFLDCLINFSRFSFKKFDWQIATIMLPLPIVGFVFHLLSKKAGWVINLFYCFLFSLLVGFALVKYAIKKSDISIGSNWQAYLILTSVSASTILLLSKPMRQYFRAGKLLLITTLAASTGLAILILTAVT
ncbi:hypothetical protein [Foetidibacter luteolus]|uniref:hypothetical protein n=1 Tax=Foetidibacter luteolus TaxID=2608880 RepID=UPI00129B1730|nr:hypothetical protein [Foetidibacter luteolus]